MADSQTTGVTLAYNVKGGIHFAEVLYGLGRLREFYSPILFRTPVARVGPKRFRRWLGGLSSARQWSRPDDLPVHPLVASDLAFRIPVPRRVMSWPRQLWTAQTLADSSLLLHAKSGSTFWFDSGMGRYSGAIMKRRGRFIVVGRRALHHDVETKLVEKLSGERRYQHPEEALSKRLTAEYRMSDLILCNSRLTQRSFLQCGYDESKLYVLMNAVDLQIYAPAIEDGSGEARTSDVLRVLYVGTLDTRKNVMGLAAACAAAGSGLELTLVGRDVEGLSAALTSLLPSCKIVGPLPTGALVDLYRRADVLVLPSFVDAYGLVAAEAMAVGTPVIVTDTCGVADVIEDGRHGYVVQAGNHDQLVARLDFLVSHREVLADMRATLLQERARLGHEFRRERIIELVNLRLPP